MKYKKHIFVCTNQRGVNAPRQSCGESNGLALIVAFKKKILELGLNVEIRAQKAGCLEICELGPNVVIYPEGVFYGKVAIEDVDEIVQEHLLHDRHVERLKLNF